MVTAGLEPLAEQALAWLRTHHSTISNAALAAAGVSMDQRERLVQHGVLARVLDGAYHHTATELGELGRCAAVCTARPDLIVAAPTAARLWQLRRSSRDRRVHVLAPPASQPCVEPWLVPYRTALIFPEHVVRRDDGIRLTSPERTVIDMVRHVDAAALASITEHAIERGYCTAESLYLTAEQMNTRGRPWVRRFIRSVRTRLPGSPSESDAELQVFTALGHRGVTDIVRQHRVALPGYGAARFDLAIPRLRWALEVDLHPEHRTIDGIAKDHRRDDAADQIGWAVMRISEADLADLEATVERVVDAIARRRAQTADRGAGR